MALLTRFVSMYTLVALAPSPTISVNDCSSNAQLGIWLYSYWTRIVWKNIFESSFNKNPLFPFQNAHKLLFFFTLCMFAFMIASTLMIAFKSNYGKENRNFVLHVELYSLFKNLSEFYNYLWCNIKEHHSVDIDGKQYIFWIRLHRSLLETINKIYFSMC
jgi:hypothetical protein